MRQKNIKLRKIQLYQFKDFNMEEFYDRYISKVHPHEELVGVSVYGNVPCQFEYKEVKKAAKRDYLVEDKCKYLQDALIRRGHAKKNEDTFSMNSQILKTVIGSEYKVMLGVLTDMGYIALGDGKGGNGKHWYYIPMDYSNLYTLMNVEVELSKPIINARIQGYKDKTIALIKEMTDKYALEYVSKDFLYWYIKSLKYIRIEDYEGLRSYIKDAVKDNPKSVIYYDFIFSELENKDRSIYRIDYSHRFYHILTNLDRNIKQYLSIDFMLDCKNSHPLLFNYFIFNKYNLSSSISYHISTFLKSIDNDYISSLSFPLIYPNSRLYHNVGEYLYNALIDNNIEKQSVAMMSCDEIEYIYKTSKGLLWDEICEQHKDMDRSEVKAAMFGAVFYAKSPISDRWNEYAKEFKRTYPTVFCLIADWKKSKNQDMVKTYMRIHHLPYKEKSSLSIAMMALEADIFTSILKRLFAKRWHAAHIHDCIVIPKDGNKNHPLIEEVKDVMIEVYRSFGLSPTFG